LLLLQTSQGLFFIYLSNTLKKRKKHTLMTSRLYNLKPINTGTPYVESLTGYIARLAEAHSVPVGTLIAKEIASILGKEYLLHSSKKGGSRFYESSIPLNGIGKTAKDWVRVLEVLTLRSDLHCLTLLKLNDHLYS